MFLKNNINGKYLIKIDCEGGERFLLKDEKCIEIIKKSCAFCLEIHFPPLKEGTSAERFKTFPKWEVWHKWINDNFAETHYILYHCSDRKRRGAGTYVLRKKDMTQPEYRA
jgi:hypothetical protein